MIVGAQAVSGGFGLLLFLFVYDTMVPLDGDDQGYGRGRVCQCAEKPFMVKGWR